MAVPYILLSAATVLFGVEFFLHEEYDIAEGIKKRKSMVFAMFVSVTNIVLAFALYGLNHKFTWFGVLIALLSSVNSIINYMFSAKTLHFGDLPLYSMFMMLGGMILPSLVGIIFYHEPTSEYLIACYLLLFIALGLGIDKNVTRNKMSLLYYFIVFLTNGLSGVFAKINHEAALGVTSGTYLLLTGLITLVIAGSFIVVKFVIKRKPLLRHPVKSVLFTTGFAVASSVGHLFLYIALETLPASVQYPFITGGTIIVSTIIALIIHEKVTIKKLIAILIALSAVTLLCISDLYL